MRLTSPNESANRLRHYGKKCEEHLSRVRLSHVLALRGLRLETQPHDTLTLELVRLSFHDGPDEPSVVKLKRGLHEVHLVALKADFELYLNRVLTVVWAGHFPSIVKKYLSKGYFSKREQAALRSLTSPELFIERVVPNYGLDALLETLKNTTEITLPNDLKDYEPSEWGQVQVAFQVRHLIEHLDGKVDDGFRRRVREFWKESSWGKTHHELDTLVKVTVNEIDVACTYNAMRQAAHSLTDALILWDSKQILAHKQF